MQFYRPNKLQLFLLLFIVYTNLLAQSQYGGFTSLTNNDGMFHDNVRCLYRDSKGFLWVGSSDGLMRYDGVFFDIFRKQKGKESTLANNNIKVISEDKYSYALWLGSQTGHITKFLIAEDRFENYFLEAAVGNSYGTAPILGIETIAKDSLIVTTEFQGLYLFRPSLNKFIPIKANVIPNRIYSSVKGDKNIYVSGDTGILQLSLGGEVLNENLCPENKFPFLYNDDGSIDVKDICEKSEGILVFSSKNSIYEYTIHTGKIKELHKSKDALNCTHIEQDHLGNYWLALNNNGVAYYNPANNSLIHHTKKESAENTLVNNTVSDILHFSDQQISWFATLQGIAKYDYNSSKFLQYDINEMGLPDANIYLLGKDSKGGYWVNNTPLCYYKPEESKEFSLFEPLRGKRATSFAEDSLNNFLIATRSGLLTYNLNSKKSTFNEFSSFGLNPKLLNYIEEIKLIDDSTCWLVSQTALIKYNTYNQEYLVYAYPKSIFGSTLYHFASTKLTNDGSELWFSTRRGNIFKFNIDSGNYSEVTIKNDDEIFSPTILDIEFDQQNRLWIATFGDGVYYYDIENQYLSDEFAYDILESHVYSILKDANNDLWMSANAGIAKVDPAKMEVQYFSKIDGTYCHEFNSKTFYLTSDNEMLFGGGSRFISFYPDSIRYNSFDAPVEIGSWLVDENITEMHGHLYEEVSYNVYEPISFEQTKQALRLYASVLDYSDPLYNSIKWKLEGFDDNWHYGYPAEAIMYHNLKPGNYNLKIKGYNPDNYESKNIATIDITVEAKFYETTLFKVLLSIIIIVVVYLMVQLRVSWYRKQELILTEKVNKKTKQLRGAYEELELSREEIYNQKGELEIHRNYLEDLVQERTRDLEEAKLKAEESDRLKTAFLANLSHEIRTPMNAIIGFSSLLQTGEFPESQQKEFLGVVHQSSESLLVLINDIIDISRIETGNIQIVKSNVILPELVKEVSDELVFEDRSDLVEYKQFFNLSPEDIALNTDRFRLKQILSNLLRNAFKFTQNGHVHLILESVDGALLENLGFSMSKDFVPKKVIVIKVIDTGIGISPEELKIIFEPFRKAYTEFKFYKGMGLGLSIVKNLLNILDGDIIVESELGKGTTFTMYINTESDL